MRLGPFRVTWVPDDRRYLAVGPVRITDRDFAALTGAEPKLSRIPPAHWRNVYQYACPEMVDAEWARANGCEELAPGIWRSSLKHISREIAEQRGCEYAARQNAISARRVVAYLRAEKFEGEGL